MTELVLILWVIWVFSHADESKTETVYNRHYDD